MHSTLPTAHLASPCTDDTSQTLSSSGATATGVAISGISVVNVAVTAGDSVIVEIAMVVTGGFGGARVEGTV